ncbi:hypothetical protein [Xanthocytophaga agilis]|uniref:Uncharacterized protein n=1 Tax=Xanthocytophaga agilis TaxID=3048010 RepID=A0AAE3R8B8_9BACT|nr:hypothetical protein [Xanthocytophaga agilis]MDJ1502613.1 hypothetical protein [Xanthocytophaga agilis]
MFSFLFKKKPENTYIRHSDKTWEKKIHKYEALCELLEQEVYPIIVAFFPKTIQEVKNVLEKRGLAFTHLESLQEDLHDEKAILLLSADLLAHPNITKVLGAISKNLTFHFAEHYPKWSVEYNCLFQLNNFKEKPVVQFYNALEEPFFIKFGGERIAELLTKFGLTEKECISHTMIDNSIKNGQQKLDKKVEIEVKASSAEDWFNKNIHPF